LYEDFTSKLKLNINKFTEKQFNFNSLIKESPYHVIKSKIKNLNFRNQPVKLPNLTNLGSINFHGYNFIKFKIKKLNFYNLYKTLDNLNLYLLNTLKKPSSHYNYDELDNT
jgi:hypothetical protein